MIPDTKNVNNLICFEQEGNNKEARLVQFSLKRNAFLGWRNVTEMSENTGGTKKFNKALRLHLLISKQFE